MIFRRYSINFLIPCSFRNCENSVFSINQDSPDSEDVTVTCLECKYTRHSSMEKYHSITNIQDFLMEQEMTYGFEWDDKVLRERVDREN